MSPIPPPATAKTHVIDDRYELHDLLGHGGMWPTPTSCEPLDCLNIALTTANLANMRDEANRLHAELSRRPHFWRSSRSGRSA